MKRMIEKRWSTDQLITGIELQDWFSMLARNGFKVDPSYFHRAAWISAWGLPLSLVGRMEDAKFGRTLAAMDINPAPIFILGHWRSGTTHLHNMFYRDPNHTTSTTFQCVFPSGFLTLGGFLPQLTSALLDDTRTYDNVKFGWHEAAEDEIALAKMTGLSPYIAFMFPDNAAKYAKYVTFDEASEKERRKWKEAFSYFIKKMMLDAGGKRVVIKSCTHAARIPMLLEMFPDAKFIHIHRNPYEVFASTLHMRSHTDWENFFHLPEENIEGARMRQTAELGRVVFEAMIQHKHLIPEENYYEIAYTDLTGNEHEVMRDMYQRLDIPDWDQAEEVLLPYLDSIKDYKRNKLNIDDEFKQFVWDEWRVVFDTYGYPQEYQP